MLRWVFIKCMTILLLTAAPLTFAQNLPDAASILRDIELMVRPVTPIFPDFELPESAAERSVPVEDQVTFYVARFLVRGNTLVDTDTLILALQPWAGRELQFADLTDATNALEALYQNEGWFARAAIPPQDVVDESILIDIFEAKLGQIVLVDADNTPISASRIEGYLMHQQKQGGDLSLTALDRSMRVLGSLPGVESNMFLASSDVPDSLDITALVGSTARFSGSLVIDNTGSRTTGPERLFITSNLNNPFRVGDRLQLSVLRTQGVGFTRLSYERPVGYMGWIWNIDGSVMNYSVLPEFGRVDSKGGALTLGAGARYPMLIADGANLNFNASVQRTHSANSLDGQDTSKRNDSLRMTLSFTRSDQFMRSGVFQGSFTWVFGEVDLNQQALGSNSDNGPAQGVFHKWTWALSRSQQLSARHSLLLSSNGQISPQKLDTGEQFTLGGAQGVRAYPGSEGSGDLGFIATIELRQIWTPEIQAIYFLDYGQVRESTAGAVGPDASPEHTALKGLGSSLNYSLPNGFSVSATWSHRLGNNPNANAEGLDNDGSLLRHRFWLQLTTQF